MKPEIRLKIALHHTLLMCANFKDKDVDKIYLMLEQWDVVPGRPPSGTYTPLAELFQKVFPTDDDLLDFLIMVERQVVNPSSNASVNNIKESLMRLYGETVAGMTKVRLFLDKIKRSSVTVKDNYCWDSGTILLDKPAYKSEIGWLLLGPGTRLRQGQLSRESMHLRMDAVLGDDDGSNT
tara:strand:+ start:880 stop:1419 length:540 start_codon:yes stop_codon:yes gene_type:complete